VTRAAEVLSQITDTVGGRRVKSSIDRRVRREVNAALKGPQGKELIAAEVTRQLAAEVTRQLAAAVAAQVSAALPAEVAAQVGQAVPAAVAEAMAAEATRDPHRVNRNFTTDLLLGVGTRTNRTLVPARFKATLEEVRTLTGVTQLDWAVKQAYQSLLDLESSGLGRVAGSNYNILGKLITPPLLSPPPGPVLEIGTLYGLFSPALIRQFRRVGEFRSLTVVDPFIGMQTQPGTASAEDPTGAPVVVQVAEHNLRHSGLAEEDLQVVVGYSTDEAVRARVAEEQYAVIVVDGDHSEEGVYQDLWWVQDIVLPGGVVVMDDFGDPGWLGVERAARRYLADGGRLELLGTVSTSAYLRAPELALAEVTDE